MLLEFTIVSLGGVIGNEKDYNAGDKCYDSWKNANRPPGPFRGIVAVLVDGSEKWKQQGTDQKVGNPSSQVPPSSDN
jgi:hypothetical protein